MTYYGRMSSFNDLMVFLGQHPNMGWLNTSDYPTPPPDDTYQTNVSTQAQAETISITVYFYSIPSGTFTINLLGENISYTSGQLNVVNYQGGFQVPQQSFAPNVSATLQVIYNKGSQPLGQYSRICAHITQTVTPEFMYMMEPMLANSSVSLPIRKMRLKMADGSLADPSDQFVLGSQNWNLNFT